MCAVSPRSAPCHAFLGCGVQEHHKAEMHDKEQTWVRQHTFERNTVVVVGSCRSVYSMFVGVVDVMQEY